MRGLFRFPNVAATRCSGEKPLFFYFLKKKVHKVKNVIRHKTFVLLIDNFLKFVTTTKFFWKKLNES